MDLGPGTPLIYDPREPAREWSVEHGIETAASPLTRGSIYFCEDVFPVADWGIICRCKSEVVISLRGVEIHRLYCPCLFRPLGGGDTGETSVSKLIRVIAEETQRLPEPLVVT